MNNVKWLFFDMGSTLIDETESYKGWFSNASESVSGALSADEIEKEYRVGHARGKPTIAGQLKPYGFMGNSADYLYPSELEKPYAEAKTVLEQLSKKYKLGIIANQKSGSESRLEKYGLLKFFDCLVVSAEVGVAKPDPQIFLLALEKADCEAKQAVMVGDRLDNDIFPAKSLGFITVRILQGYGRLQTPKTSEYEPHFTVDSLTKLLNIF